MPTNAELYDYYCRRSTCHPNSSLKKYLASMADRPLEVVDVSLNYVGSRGLIPVLDLVKNTKTVHTLDVSHHELGQAQVQHLAYCLALHPSLRRLRLRDAGLHDDHADVLLQLLRMNSVIEELQLDGNNLSPSCVAALTAALEENHTARRLRSVEDAAHAAYLDEKSGAAATAAAVRRSYCAVLTGCITAADSGGYLHYATWWKNPQYAVKTSRTSRVSFLLESTQADARANQMGLLVLHHDGVHRVVEVIPGVTVVAESAVADRECTIETTIDVAESYVVVPFTFNPGHALPFRLTATLLNDHPAQEEGWVTLDPLDARYDWCVHNIADAAWTAENAGGSGRHTTWRRNDMYHLTCEPTDTNNNSSSSRKKREATTTASGNGPEEAAAVATVYILLVKTVDPYANDDRAIGIDVVTHDPHNAAAPPLQRTSDVVRAALPHAATSFALLKVAVPLSQLDVYVVPSTELPGQTGPYTLTVFSSVAVQLTRSSFPHGWRYRALRGAWDATCCGGCRAECGSWKNNPAVAVQVGDVAQPLIACVELRETSVDGADGVASEAAAAEDAEKKEEKEEDDDPAAVQRRAELTTFLQRHRRTPLEVGVMVVDPLPPAYSILAASPQLPHAAAVEVACPARPTLYVVPMLRHAAEVAAYTLELFSPSAFIVDGNDEIRNDNSDVSDDAAAVCLAVRERQAQLAAYSAESDRRDVLRQTVGGGGAVHDSAVLQALRTSIFALVGETGTLFTDRDFPRGASSLFLDPSAPLPFDFPAETAWRRVSELAMLKSDDGTLARVQEVSPATMSPPLPHGPRQWFASVVQAVAAKPGWLPRIFVQYAREAGVAQFAFYKQDDWVGVTVDDYLLVDHENTLVYGHSADPRDFFFALAEKAYAKLHRCYEALEPKVNPEQSALDLLSQGLQDVTGGFTTVQRIRSFEKPAEMPSEERDELWRRLKASVDPSLLCSLTLVSDHHSKKNSAARERGYVGVLPGRLYGVVDARFVEQQRLVKLRVFRDAAAWKGKWRFDSPRWTATLRDVLHYHAAEPDAVWMHYDELLYYFTHVLVTEVCARTVHMAGSFAEAAEAEAEAEDEEDVEVADGAVPSLRNPQYALTITPTGNTVAGQVNHDGGDGTVGRNTSGEENSKAGDGDDHAVVEVHVGLHRRDPRLDITRTKDATAQLKTCLGFAVFATADNHRHLRHVTAGELLHVVPPNTERDQHLTLRLPRRVLRTQQITIMPFRNAPHQRQQQQLLSSSSSQAEVGVPFTLSVSSAVEARSGVASLQLSYVTPNRTTTVVGRWPATLRKSTAPTSPQWRDNPQFFLSTSDAGEATLTLRPTHPTTARLGFTVHRTRHCSSFLRFDADSVVATATGVAGSAPSCVVRLAGTAERRGMPYVVVPYYSSSSEKTEENEENGDVEFQLEVTCNHRVQLRAIDARLDWHRLRYDVSINADAGNAGGGPAYPSWRFNTQLVLTFPVEREGRVFIAARRTRSADPRVKVGLLLLRAEAPVAGSFRRRLTYSSDDVIARAVESTQESVLDTEVVLPRDHGALLLVVYADQPYKEAEVEVCCYTAATMTLEPAQAWPTVLAQEGSWALGTTAAGSRSSFASWINNPFYALTVLRPTRVTLLLVQYPRDHELPVVRRHGAQKALLPPPLFHPDRCTAIQLSVVAYDAALTELAATVPTTQAETTLTLELTPAQSYFVVPCTTEPQRDGDFKLFAFADQPMELYVAEKPRLPYV